VQHRMVTGYWARSSVGWARWGATALEKAAASASRDGGTHGSACVRLWGKDRMRAAVRKEMSSSFFFFFEETVLKVEQSITIWPDRYIGLGRGVQIDSS